MLTDFILTIFGIIVAEEIYNKSMHVYSSHLFTVLIPYLLKIMTHLAYLCLHGVSLYFKKRHPFYCLWLLGQMLTDFYNFGSSVTVDIFN